MNGNKLSYRVNDGFVVSKLLQGVSMDFLYSTNAKGEFLLLNQHAFGNFTWTSINKQIQSGKKVVVINNDTLMLDAYNIDEDTLVNFFLTMEV